jgi:hypothetical protein
MLRRMKVRLLFVVLLVLTACTTTTVPSSAPSASPPPASASPSEAPTPTPRPSQTPSLAYEPATVPASANGSATLTVVPGGEGLVAIGFDGAFGSLLWTSADGGQTWTDITPADFASIGIASVVEFDGMLVGVGRGDTINVDAEEAAVYLSDDGVSWRKVDTTTELVGQMIDVVATDDGLFAVGGVPGADSAGVWHSLDAQTWTRVGGDFEHAFLWSIAEGGPGLVAVGWRRNPEPDLAVWTSADAGQNWKLAPDPEGFAGFEATDVAALPDGTLAMVGSALDGSRGRIWHSTDGATWALAADDMGGVYARSVTLTHAGLVATGGGEDMNGRAWLSTDGVAWTPLGDPVQGAFFTGAVATPDGVLLTGGTQAGTPETGIVAHAAVWLGTFGN